MTPDTLPPGDDKAEIVNPAIDPMDENAEVDLALFEEPDTEPPFLRAVRMTPLHLAVAAESRVNRWSRWGGFTTPDVLTDMDEEYRALRGAAALFDISPLVKYRIAGRDARGYLDRLLTRSVASLPVDGVMRVLFCEDHGLVLGDGLLFRLGDDEYRLVTEETHLAWLLDSAEGFRVRVEDVSETLAAMSLQGPLAAFCLAAVGVAGIETLPPSASRWVTIAGMPVYASRTGATGDLGYELWCDPEDAPQVWLSLLREGAAFGVRPAGFAVRELARLEAGLPRAGKDYLGAFAAIDPVHARTPFELGLARHVEIDGRVFNGAAALARLAAAGPAHSIVCLRATGLEAARLVAVHTNGVPAGPITSHGFSPALGANIALATLGRAALTAGNLSVDAEIPAELGLRRVSLPAQLMQAPAWSVPRRLAVPAPLKA